MNHILRRHAEKAAYTAINAVMPQTMVLVERLRALGVAAEYHYYGDRDHVLGHVFHCNVRLSEAQRCNRDECDYFKKFC